MAEHLEHGAQVIAHGRLTVYEARGELQIVVDFVQPEGVGLAPGPVRATAHTSSKKRACSPPTASVRCPPSRRRIGVVTSPAGAVFHDICNVLTRRWPLAEVVLAPTPVQGPDAPYGVVGGIETLNLQGDIDVIIVARGGGSHRGALDLQRGVVARAVFGSLVPVVSAVGHETDFTICDYVADLRAPTPSAAAELVVPDAQQFCARNCRASPTYGLDVMQQRIDRERGAVEVALARARRAP